MEDENNNTVSGWLAEAERCFEDGEVMNFETFMRLASKRAENDESDYVKMLMKQATLAVVLYSRDAAKDKLEEIRAELAEVELE